MQNSPGIFKVFGFISGLFAGIAGGVLLAPVTSGFSLLLGPMIGALIGTLTGFTADIYSSNSENQNKAQTESQDLSKTSGIYKTFGASPTKQASLSSSPNKVMKENISSAPISSPRSISQSDVTPTSQSPRM